MPRITNTYRELAKASIQPTRNIVISEVNHSGFTLAQQMVVQEGRRQTNVFLKGGWHIDSVEGLYNLRDALNEALEALEYQGRDLDSSCGP